MPDLALAVGPDHLVAATNQDIAVFGKACIPTCLPLWSERFLGLNGFWDESVLGLGLFPDGQDPLVFYDSSADRFFVTAQLANKRKLLVAVSATSDPTQGWIKYVIDPMTVSGIDPFNFQALDRPSASVDADTLYISFWGKWGLAPPFELRTALIALDKNELLTGQTGNIVQNKSGVLLPQVSWRKIHRSTASNSIQRTPRPCISWRSTSTIRALRTNNTFRPLKPTIKRSSCTR